MGIGAGRSGFGTGEEPGIGRPYASVVDFDNIIIRDEGHLAVGNGLVALADIQVHGDLAVLGERPEAVAVNHGHEQHPGRVTAVGARVLCEAVPAMEAGTLKPQPQQHENATLAPMLDKELAEFRLTDTAAHIHNWVRGMNPWPMAWFVTAGGKKVKVTECRVAASNGEAPGTVLSTKPLTVACADGAVQLLHVVPEGKKPMDGTSFAAGLRLKAGDTL